MTTPTWKYETSSRPARPSLSHTPQARRVPSRSKDRDYETTDWGNLMLSDGAVMLTTRDNFLYHEMMSHPALVTHADPKHVVIIAAATAARCAKCSSIPASASVQCDIDGRSRAWPRNGSRNGDRNGDARAELLFDDGSPTCELHAGQRRHRSLSTHRSRRPAQGLFNQAFYESCFPRSGTTASSCSSPNRRWCCSTDQRDARRDAQGRLRRVQDAAFRSRAIRPMVELHAGEESGGFEFREAMRGQVLRQQVLQRRIHRGVMVAPRSWPQRSASDAWLSSRLLREKNSARYRLRRISPAA